MNPVEVDVMSKQTRIKNRFLRFLSAFLLVWFLSAGSLWAAPPLPDDYTPEKEEEYELYDDEIIQFSEDYVDLIEELEDVLEEFNEFFEEFGQVSIKEYTKAISKLRLTLKEEYSSKSHEGIMISLNDLLHEFESLEYELKESDSRSRHRRLRNLKALEDDLEDIREQLDDQVGDVRLRYQLDAETLSEIITRALEQADKAMEEASWVIGDDRVFVVPPVPEPPDVPEPKSIPQAYAGGFSRGGTFDGSMTQSGSATVDDNTTVIEVENALGGIEAETWNRSEVSVVLDIGYKENSRRSLSLAREIKLTIDKSPTTVRVHVDYPERDESINIVSSRLNISLPRSNPVSIKNSFGPVNVADLDNTLRIHSNFSTVDIQHIKSDVFIANSSGSVYAEDIGGALEITNSFAPIEAVFANGGAKLTNSYAPIMVEKSSGRLDINTSGEVTVDRHKGQVYIRSSNGRIEIFGITGDLIAINSFGTMQIEGISGNAEIENANAPIEITEVGGFLKVSNNFAPIEISDIDKEVTVRSSNGRVSIENTKAGVNVSNRFGEVSVESVTGPVTITNANDPVTVSRVFAPVTVVNQFGTVTVSGIDGSVSIENANASVNLSDIKGSSKVKTSFGLISCENLGGSFIIGNENGSVELMRVVDISTDCEVKTTFGDILLAIPQVKSYNLKATTSYGRIESDIPMNVSSSGNIYRGEYVAGKANPTITLTGNNSTIKITTE